MATSDPDLVDEIRSFAQYKDHEIDDSDLAVAISRAKKHLKIESGLNEEQIDWYDIERQEDALFWTSMLFSKVQTGALDAKAVSVGAINESELLTGDSTQWYRSYRQSMKNLVVQNRGSRVSRSSRTTSGGNRVYEDREL